MAECAACHVAGITGQQIAADGTGIARTVSITTTATGWVEVEVECSNLGAAAAKATFVAHDGTACLSPLGVLRHGTLTFTGSLSAASCVSAKRPGGSESRFRAHRYSFTLASSGWVSVGLEPTGTGADALDTYLVLLAGHGSGGAVLESHNNLRGDATEH